MSRTRRATGERKWEDLVILIYIQYKWVMCNDGRATAYTDRDTDTTLVIRRGNGQLWLLLFTFFHTIEVTSRRHTYIDNYKQPETDVSSSLASDRHGKAMVVMRGQSDSYSAASHQHITSSFILMFHFLPFLGFGAISFPQTLGMCIRLYVLPLTSTVVVGFSFTATAWQFPSPSLLSSRLPSLLGSCSWKLTRIVGVLCGFSTLFRKFRLRQYPITWSLLLDLVIASDRYLELQRLEFT